MNDEPARTHPDPIRTDRSRKIAFTILLISNVVLWSWRMAVHADRTLRRDLLQETRLVALALDRNAIRSLEGSAADRTSAAYRNLKDRLMAVRSVNAQFRFIYLMGRRADGTIFFFVDNEPEGAETGSPPGQVYEEASDSLREMFDGKPMRVEGPLPDAWGVWVSALIPLKESDRDPPLAVLGVDIAARDWRWNVLSKAALPVGLLLFGVMGFLVAFWIWRNARISRRQQAAVRESEEKLSGILNNMTEVVWSATWPDMDRMLFLSPSAEALYGRPVQAFFDRPALWREAIHPDDRAQAGTVRDRLGETDRAEIEYRVVRADGTATWVHDRTRLIRDAGGRPYRLDGILSNITERKQAEARMIREMDAAGALQRKLLATDPFFGDTAEVRFAHRSSLSVGGDVFNAMTLPDGRLCLYVCDVAGHGVGPAMVSTLLKALVDEVVFEHAAAGPAAMCTFIHERFRHYVTNPELYATMFLALLEPDGRCIAFNCGHPMPLLFDAQGNAQPGFEDRGGLPIGLTARGEAAQYESADEVRAVLPPGGRMAVFSDGLVEALQAGSLQPCGVRTLDTVLSDMLKEPFAADSAGLVLDRLADLGYQLAADDCTLMVATHLNPEALCLDRQIPVTHRAVADLAAEVCRVLQARGWPEEAAGAVQLLTMEHGANVVDHAATPPGSFISLRVRLSDAWVHLLFGDAGRDWPYEERLHAPVAQGAESSRGRGLQIIHAIARHMDVVRRDGRNECFYVVARNFNGMLSDQAAQEPPRR